jgi:hypothetical protein
MNPADQLFRSICRFLLVLRRFSPSPLFHTFKQPHSLYSQHFTCSSEKEKRKESKSWSNFKKHRHLGNKKMPRGHTCPETILLANDENTETRHDHAKEHIEFAKPREGTNTKTKSLITWWTPDLTAASIGKRPSPTTWRPRPDCWAWPPRWESSHLDFGGSCDSATKLFGKLVKGKYSDQD